MIDSHDILATVHSVLRTLRRRSQRNIYLYIHIHTCLQFLCPVRLLDNVLHGPLTLSEFPFLLQALTVLKFKVIFFNSCRLPPCGRAAAKKSGGSKTAIFLPLFQGQEHVEKYLFFKWLCPPSPELVASKSQEEIFQKNVYFKCSQK